MFRKFFPRDSKEEGEEEDAPPVDGSPFFNGKYLCVHCHGTHAQWGRFTLPGATTLTFCTPECAAAYNILHGGDSTQHKELEAQCGRNIHPAPMYSDFKHHGRDVCLARVRAHLTPSDWHCIHKEMIVVTCNLKKR